MLLRIHRRLLIYGVLLCVAQCAYAQLLEWAPCAVSCITQVTVPIESCEMGFRCFCNDQPLYEEAIDCWQSNCTIREALTSRNITATTCQFPDRDIGPSGTAVTFASMGIALIFVAMQLMVFATTRAWGVDDILIAVGTLAMIGNAICNPFARSFGFGKDAWRITFDDSANILKVFYIGGIVYVFGVAVVKAAFLCFYIRLFPTSRVRKVAYPILGITVAQGITFVFLFAFQCSPISYAWLQWDGEAEGSCLGFEIGAAAHAIVNILLDLVIFALPIFSIRSLNLSKKKRWQVLLMFSVGFFVTLVSIIRIPSLVAVGESNNLSRDYIALGYWSDLELNIGIACFCMPAARVIIRRYFPDCGLASTGHDTSYDPKYPTTIGSKGMAAMHRKKLSGGKMVDVTLDDETGQIVPKNANGTVTEYGGSTVVDMSSRNRDSDWPLPSTAEQHDLERGNYQGPVAKMPKSHASKHSIGMSSASITTPHDTEYSHVATPATAISTRRGRPRGNSRFTHSTSHFRSAVGDSDDSASDEIELVPMTHPGDGKGGTF